METANGSVGTQRETVEKMKGHVTSPTRIVPLALMLAATACYLEAWGRRGEGPGDFSTVQGSDGVSTSVFWMERWPGDSLAVCSGSGQALNNVVSVWDTRGRHGVQGFVETPPGLVIHQIGEDFILGKVLDELRVEYVQLWGLDRRAAQTGRGVAAALFFRKRDEKQCGVVGETNPRMVLRDKEHRV